MADDLDRFDDDDEEDSAPSQPSAPFFSGIFGKILIILGVLVFMILLSALVANIIFEIRIGGLGSYDEVDVIDDEFIHPVDNPEAFIMENLILNLDDGAYLAVTLHLAYDGNNNLLKSEILRRSAHVTSIVRYILESNVSSDINTTEKRNRYLKPKIIDSVNEILREGKIYAVYFTEFSIQLPTLGG